MSELESSFDLENIRPANSPKPRSPLRHASFSPTKQVTSPQSEYSLSDFDNLPSHDDTIDTIDTKQNNNSLKQSNEEEVQPELISVKKRFEYAVQMQKQREQERLNQVKQVPMKRISSMPSQKSPSTVSHSTKSTITPPNQFTERFRTKELTPNRLWNEALQDLKQKQDKRTQLQRNNQLTQVDEQLTTIQLVTQRINEWEELTIQVEPSGEEIAEIWRHLKQQMLDCTSEQEASLRRLAVNYHAPTPSVEDSDSIQQMPFTIGSTRLFTASSLGSTMIRYLRRAISSRSKHVGICCGLISSNKASTRLPIRVISIAIRDETGRLYVAMHIKPQVGYEHHFQSHEKYDAILQKIILCSSSVDHEKLIETEFMLSFESKEMMQFEENLSFVDESFEIASRLETSMSSPVLKAITPLRELTPKPFFPMKEQLLSSDVVSAYFDMVLAANLNSSSNINEVEEVSSNDDLPIIQMNTLLSDISSPITPSSPEPTLTLHAIEMKSPVSCASSEIESIYPISPMIQRPESESSIVEEEFSSTQQTRQTEEGEENNNYVSEEAVKDIHMEVLTNNFLVDEQVLFSQSASNTTASRAFLSLDLTHIDEIFTTDRLFVATNTKSETSLLISPSFKVDQAQARCCVADNKIFEWNRGVNFSGWLHKWPTSSNGFGKASRRYFTIYDNKLIYSKVSLVPTTNVMDVRTKEMLLTENTTLEICSNMFQKCLKIYLPAMEKTLFLRLPRDTVKANAWIHAFQRSIDIQRLKRQSLATTIKTYWFQEDSTCQLIAVDVASSEETHRDTNECIRSYTKIALFRFANQRYSIEVSSNENPEHMHLDILLTNEISFEVCDLTTVKLYGDKIIFGGSKGFVGIGIVGRTTGVSLDRPRKVMYVLPCKYVRFDQNYTITSAITGNTKNNSKGSLPNKFTKRQEESSTSTLLASFDRVASVDLKHESNDYPGLSLGNSHKMMHTSLSFYDNTMLPHALESSIQFIAYSDRTDIFVTVDTNQRISIWYLEKCSKPILQSPTQPKKVGYYYNIQPEYQSSMNYSLLIEKSGKYYENERIVSVNFLSHPNMYLIISTTKRLLLVTITFQFTQNNLQNNFQNTNTNLNNNSNNYSSHVAMDTSEGYYAIDGFVELDAVETKEQIGLFSMECIEPHFLGGQGGGGGNSRSSPKTLSTSSQESLQPSYLNTLNTNINNINNSNSLSVTSKGSTALPSYGERRMSHHLSTYLDRKIIAWRFLMNETNDIITNNNTISNKMASSLFSDTSENDIEGNQSHNIVNLCVGNRMEWSNEKFNSYIRNVRSI